GIYLFDNVTTKGTHRVESADAIRANVQQTVDGKLTTERVNARNLTVMANAQLTPKQGLDLGITVDELLRVETSGAIELTGKGYAPEVSYPGATIPSNGNGGSHMGVGGWLETNRASTFGSVVRPRELGGGSDYSTPSEGRAGGGAVSIVSNALVVNGVIRANGAGDNATNSRGGAGGSIWIRTSSIAGSGIIEANGGDAYWGPGGGGALSLSYASGTPPQLRARPGAKLTNTAATRPGSGTIYTFGPSSVWGDLRVDNDGIAAFELTALHGVGSGIAQTGSAGATLVTDRLTAIPAFFEGHWIEVSTAAGSVKGMWRIATVNNVTVTLAPNANESVDVAVGDRWRGVYRFDTLTIRGSKLTSSDAILTTSAVDKDAASTLEVNEAPTFPTALRAQLVVAAVNGSDVVTAPAGAVTDPHPPIALAVTNVRTGVKFTGTAAANGSFTIPVSGASGDTFTIRATDSHTLPLTSAAIAVNGSIAAPAISSIVIQPNAVAGGENAIGTVRLVDAARSDGAIVALSSDSAFATVPATVAIVAGTQSAQFVVQTSAPSSNLNAVITATAANSKSATLSIAAGSGALLQLALDSASVTGGTSVNGTVILGAPAPEGGALVTLAASDTLVANVPASVVVPAGSTMASFTITTAKVGAASSVTISGVYGATQTADLALTACTALGTVAPPAPATLATVVLDESLPAGATVTGDGAFTNTQAASGTQSILLTGGPGAHAYSVSGISMTPQWTDTLVGYVLVNPCNPPKQILMTWTSGSTTYRASWGESRISTDPHTRMGAVPQGGTWVRLDTLARPLGVALKTITSVSVQTFGGEAWFDKIGVSSCLLPKLAVAPNDPREVLWFEDATPPGATLTTSWEWTTNQAAGGTQSVHRSAAAGWHQHVFENATTPIIVQPGDVFYTYVLMDPCDPPLEVMLQFHDSNWSYRAYWGENLIPFGTDGTISRVRMGPLPAAGGWVRLEVPAALLGMEGKSINGMGFTFWDGHGWFDRTGVLRQVNLAAGKSATQSSNFTAANSAAKAVDGITNGNNSISPVAITAVETQPWWQVDLGAAQPIHAVQLWNRSDSGSSQLANVWLFVSDTPIATTTVAATRALTNVSSYKYVIPVGPSLTYYVDRPARYVRVQLEGSGNLQLAEVQVFAPLTASRANVAGGRANAVTQISTDSSSGPERAVNGTVVPVHANAQSIAVTLAAPNAWWEVDLGSLQTIDTIDVWNRTDSNFGNLVNYWVLVSDTPFPQDLTQALAQGSVAAYYQGAGASIGYSFPISRRGRYVRVQLAGNSILQLAEVQVWTRDATLAPLAR
ncbi:MAG TPA: discoidin domain-containing protein, partial [Thermoanaerobaculia bacterium]